MIKSQITNSKFQTNDNNQAPNFKRYDLEERTFEFAKQIISFVNMLQKTIVNIEIIKQLIRSSGSVGANYIEANESLSRKDFIMRIKICRKEIKERRYWLRLIEVKDNDEERERLIVETTELIKIFSKI
ncbi:MAG: four helix bundle protein, partial [Candidatus Omnitrophica bacterium]|nr:four helix bundle protein [Candidatus Omnitrophota bacterium]